MKRFVSLFTQDLLISYRSGIVLIVGLLLLVMSALILFLPREIKVHNELILDASPGTPLAAYLRSMGVDEGVVYTDEAAFRADLERQPNKVGVVFSGGLDVPAFEIITNSAIPEANLGLLEASLDRAMLELRGTVQDSIPVEYLRPVSAPPAFNVRFVPVAIVFEVVLLGFMIVAVMMFQEKQEGTLRAYRVSPAGAWEYIFSKNALFVVLSFAYGLPLLFLAFGLGFNLPLMLVLIALSSLFMTTLSLAIAVFFNNLSEWFFAGVAILVLNSLPMISYGLPAFAPTWLTWIPSYPSVFAIRAVLFNGATFGDTLPTILYLTALTALALAAAYVAIRYKLLKEGR
jgi:ABC-2 type transport system permease protein/fluoroquinolone transport system permease protein